MRAEIVDIEARALENRLLDESESHTSVGELLEDCSGVFDGGIAQAPA